MKRRSLKDHGRTTLALIPEQTATRNSLWRLLQLLQQVLFLNFFNGINNPGVVKHVSVLLSPLLSFRLLSAMPSLDAALACCNRLQQIFLH
jgi:hypothetical protein